MTTISIDTARRLEAIRGLKPMTLAEQRKASIKDVSVGGYLIVNGKLYLVQEKHRYAEGKKRDKWVWWELKLFSCQTGEYTHLEWEEDDFIIVSLWPEIGLNLHKLNLTKDQLWEMDEEEEGSFHFRGTALRYDDSGKARFHRGCGSEGENFYYWDFESDDGELLIGVEEWDGDFEVCIGYPVDINQIRILSKGGDDN